MPVVGESMNPRPSWKFTASVGVERAEMVMNRCRNGHGSLLRRTGSGQTALEFQTTPRHAATQVLPPPPRVKNSSAAQWHKDRGYEGQLTSVRLLPRQLARHIATAGEVEAVCLAPP